MQGIYAQMQNLLLVIKKGLPILDYLICANQEIAYCISVFGQISINTLIIISIKISTKFFGSKWLPKIV